MGTHPTLQRITLKNSKLGCVLEAELRRFERAILEMAAAPTQLNTLVLEQIFSNTVAMSDEDLGLKK